MVFCCLASLSLAPAARAGNLFFVQPCRVLDTRTPPGAPALAANTTRVVQISGSCGVPASAETVFLNLVEIAASADGSIVVFPANQAGSAVTVINFHAGVYLANDVIAQLATDGSGTLAIQAVMPAGGTSHLAADVLGYSSADTSPPDPSTVGPLGFQPVAACRVADTRVSGGVLQAREDRSFGVQGRCNIPFSVTVAALSLKAVKTTGPGYLAVHSGDVAFNGRTSTLVFTPGRLAVANGAVTRLGGPSGADVGIASGSSGATHVVIDTVGYFNPDAASTYQPIGPCRVVDTRFSGNPWLSGETRSVDARASCAPGDAHAKRAAFINITMLQPTSDGYLVTSLPGEAVPAANTANFSGGETALSTGAIAQLDPSGQLALTARMWSGAQVHLIVDVLGYFEVVPESRPSFPKDPPSSGDLDGIHPAAERGFHPEKLYQFGDLDHVNLFNGNLSVNLPIGERYPVGGGLAYGVSLAYNSKIYDFKLHRIAHSGPGGGPGSWENQTETEPNLLSNAGVGWFLSVGGRLLSPDDVENNSGGPLINGTRDVPANWAYVSPDGAEHVFYSRLTVYPTTNPQDTALYTRDGSYLRMRSISRDVKEIDFPDGRAYRFTFTALGVFGGGIQMKWALTAITNQFSRNLVAISYQYLADSNLLQWTVTDSQGRTQYVQFEQDPSGFYPLGRVHAVLLTAPQSSSLQTAQWTFNYVPASFVRCRDTFIQDIGKPLNGPQLVSIDLPDGTSYSFGYRTTGGCDEGSGLLSRVNPPTAGSSQTCNAGSNHCAGIEWTYRGYQLPIGTCDARTHFKYTSGVQTRTVYDSLGNAAGTWSYSPQLTAVDSPVRVLCDDAPAVEVHDTYTNTVTTPLGDQTVHHFSVFPRQAYDESAGRHNPNDYWEEFGLPFDRRSSITSLDGQQLFLSTEIKSCGVSGCSTVASTYVRYERDASLAGGAAPGPFDFTDHYDLQRRPAVERILYADASTGHFVETAQSDFDGLGHYRTTVQRGGGTWPRAGGTRTTTISYNPANGSYLLDDNGAPSSGFSYTATGPSGPCQPSSCPSWLLDTYSTKQTIENPALPNQPGAEGERACFNPTTGFLERRRMWRNGTGDGPHDVLIVDTPDPAGNVASREFDGSDLSSLDTSSDLCGLTNLPGALYKVNYSYSGGLLKAKDWVAADGASVVMRTYDATIDVAGARVASTTEPDGIRTDYAYDVMGRLTQELPGNGQTGTFGASTFYTYNNVSRSGCSAASPADSCASVLVGQYAGTSPSGNTLARRRVVFDGLGRIIRDGTGAPGLQPSEWSEEVTTYDGMGRLASKTPRHTQPAFPTLYQGYDALGRLTRIVPPDGDAHAVTISYNGVKSESRIVKVSQFTSPFPVPANQSALPAIAEQNAMTTSLFDAFHRLVSVVENSASATDQLVSDYKYDVGGRLAHVEMASGAVTQTRDFFYDSLGRLRGVIQPELRHSGDPTTGATTCGGGPLARDVVFDKYDPLGHFLRRCDERFDLTFKYDRAQRPTEVRRTGLYPEASCDSELGTCLRKFSYGSGTSPGDRSNGKLVRASQVNYRSETVGSTQLYGAAEIVYDHAYDGTRAADGRMSSRTLSVNISTDPAKAPAPSVEQFYQTFSYTPLGALASADYPSCAFAPCNATTAPARSVALSYEDGSLTYVAGYANLTYSPSSMLRRVTFSNGSIWQQDPDPNHLRRPQLICEQPPNTPDRAVCPGGLGPFSYDGAGNVTAVGTETYVYDPESRVVYGQFGSGSYQRYTYDRYGNAQSKTNGLAWSVPGGTQVTDVSTINMGTYRTSNQLAGAYYDASGNLVYWNGNSYAYDEFNRLAIVHQGSQAWWYVYAPDGERVWSYRPGILNNPPGRLDHWTLRGLDRKVLRVFDASAAGSPWTWSWTKDYVYRDGAALAYETPSGQGRFLLDHLGSPRRVYAENGTSRLHSYYPFGEELAFTAGETETLKFTGQERDLFDTSGPGDDLDYMHARHYSPILERFLSVDSGGASPAQPQSWNRYAYVQDSPVRLIDPDGRAPLTPLEQVAPYLPNLPPDTLHYVDDAMHALYYISVVTRSKVGGTLGASYLGTRYADEFFTRLTGDDLFLSKIAGFAFLGEIGYENVKAYEDWRSHLNLYDFDDLMKIGDKIHGKIQDIHKLRKELQQEYSAGRRSERKAIDNQKDVDVHAMLEQLAAREKHLNDLLDTLWDMAIRGRR